MDQALPVSKQRLALVMHLTNGHRDRWFDDPAIHPCVITAHGVSAIPATILDEREILPESEKAPFRRITRTTLGRGGSHGSR